MYSPGAAKLGDQDKAQDTVLKADLPLSQHQEYACHVFASTVWTTML